MRKLLFLRFPKIAALSSMCAALLACGGASPARDGGAADGGAASLDGGALVSDAGASASDGGASGDGGASLARVHGVYLVPADREERPEYAAQIASALRHLQRWYREQLGGITFTLADPPVVTLRTTREAAGYASTPSGDEAYYYFFYNVANDGFELTGGRYFDEENVWIYYVDADPACGQIGGGGTPAVAVLPANDLRGLAGEPRLSPCPDEPPDRLPRCRWVGGLGHELGHAFELPHPPDCDAGRPSCDESALLWLGYSTYPDAHFTRGDAAVLARSPFFAPSSDRTPSGSCASR